MGTTITATKIAGPVARAGIGVECKYTLLLDTTDGSGLMTCDITDDFSQILTVKIDGDLASTGYVIEVQKPAVTALAAQGTLTLTGIATADETMLIGTTTLTAKATADAGADVDYFDIGAGTAAQQVTGMVATLAECTGNEAWVGTDGAGDTVLITAAVAGSAGDAIVLTGALANCTVDGGGTIGGTRAGLDANVALTSTNLVFGFYEAATDGNPLDAIATTDLSTTITGLTITVTGKSSLVTSWA